VGRTLLVDNLVSPSHRVFLVSQGACVEGCMLRVTYMTQTSSLPHVHVLNSVHRCFMLDTINTGAQSNVTLFEFVGVRMSVFVTGYGLITFHLKSYHVRTILRLLFD
jgi:hypothetical protein